MSSPSHSSKPRADQRRHSLGDPVVLGLSAGFIVLFVVLSLYDSEAVASTIGAGFAWTAAMLGSYFQLLLLLTFFIAMGLTVSPASNARIGNVSKPDTRRDVQQVDTRGGRDRRLHGGERAAVDGQAEVSLNESVLSAVCGDECSDRVDG